MFCDQKFAVVKDGEVINVIVCDNDNLANDVVKQIYGEDAFAVDFTYYEAGIGDFYKNGEVYRETEIGKSEILKTPDVEETVEQLTESNDFLVEMQIVTACQTVDLEYDL